MIEQDLFECNPQVGEIWTVFDEIVMVVRIGSNGLTGFMPNCIEYIGVGAARYDFCGRFWEVDYIELSELPDPYWAPTGTMRCDRCYFKPWNGRGVFYATRDGQKANALLAQYRKAKPEIVQKIYARLEALFGRQIARDGFK